MENLSKETIELARCQTVTIKTTGGYIWSMTSKRVGKKEIYGYARICNGDGCLVAGINTILHTFKAEEIELIY